MTYSQFEPVDLSEELPDEDEDDAVDERLERLAWTHKKLVESVALARAGWESLDRSRRNILGSVPAEHPTIHEALARIAVLEAEIIERGEP